ncbi:MAG: hypothetical protein Tp152DCM46671_16 [Prokaryotic dsDNA virus sp.]|nr:MAG: hypothetical protein Tp152DCM46671_16 [Prokaryotic dsDNA virus sp.]|tara:strand:+ start:8927 stop:9097 length:171 start_codon:yes stop_codon:yes gene_type:complete
MKGKIMSKKRNWGQHIPKFCPKTKTVWQKNRLGKIIILLDMPTYGLKREEMPNETN